MRMDGFILLPFISSAVWAWSGFVFAETFHHSVALPLTLEYDSNPALTPTNVTSVWRARFSPEYAYTGQFGVDELKAGLRLNIEQSSDDAVSENRQDPVVSLGWRRQTETGTFGLQGRYEMESTRVAELNESGQITIDGTRTTQVLSANWRREFSERSYFSPYAEYRAVSYDKGSSPNYDNVAGGLTYGYAWTERLEPSLQIKASRFEPDSIVQSSENNYTVLGSLKFKVSETLDLSGQVGGSRVDGVTADTGWVGNMSMSQQGEISSLSLNVGRSVKVNGQNGFYAEDSVLGLWSQSLSATTRLGADAEWQKTYGSTPNTLYQAGAWGSQELSPFFNARLSLQYKQRHPVGQASASESIIALSLVYNHPDF